MTESIVYNSFDHADIFEALEVRWSNMMKQIL